MIILMNMITLMMRIHLIIMIAIDDEHSAPWHSSRQLLFWIKFKWANLGQTYIGWSTYEIVTWNEFVRFMFLCKMSVCLFGGMWFYLKLKIHQSSSTNVLPFFMINCKYKYLWDKAWCTTTNFISVVVPKVFVNPKWILHIPKCFIVYNYFGSFWIFLFWTKTHFKKGFMSFWMSVKFL